MRHFEVFTGNIGKVGELKTSGNDNSFITFSIAETPRTRTESGEWVDGDTLWTECMIFGKTAVTFAKSDIKPGTRVMVAGVRRARKYTTKNNEERVAETIMVDNIAVLVDYSQYVVETGRLNTATGEDFTTAAPKSSTAKKTATKKVAKPKVEEDDEFDLSSSSTSDVFDLEDDDLDFDL